MLKRLKMLRVSIHAEIGYVNILAEKLARISVLEKAEFLPLSL